MFEDLIPAAPAGGGAAPPSAGVQDDLTARPVRIVVDKPPQNALASTAAPDQPQPATEAGPSSQPAKGKPALSARDKAILIRTVLGEAAGEPDDGQKAVAAVVLNRLQSGKFGNSLPNIVLAKSQFEPWSSPEGRKRMLGYASDSPEYQRAAANIDAILNGDEDPTGGATHFYAPKAQTALGRAAPNWAQGEPLAVIGGHQFYSPDDNAKPTRMAANKNTAVMTDAGSGGGADADAAPAIAFDDLIPAGKAATPPAASFAERFSGDGMGTPSKDAPALAEGLRKAADEKLIGPSDTGQQLDTFNADMLNTFLLNAPRNLKAAVWSQIKGEPFEKVYADLKAREEAGSRQNPASSGAGTAAGIAASIAGAPGIKLAAGGAKTLIGRAGEAALTGAAYGATSELLDSKDPIKASVAAGLGAALGGVAAPVAEKIVGLVAGAVKAGKAGVTWLKPDGSLSDEAAVAAREAGIDPEQLRQVMLAKYADTFKRKGVTPSSVREANADEFGINLSPGEAADDYGKIASEQAMARDARGPLAGKAAREFFDGREQQVTRAKTGIQERVAEQQPLVDSVNDAANVIGQGARGKASKAKAQYKDAYDDALARDGEFSDIAFRDIGERIRRDGLKAPEPVVINPKTTPVASAAIDHLDANIGKLKVVDKAQPRSMEPVTAGTHQFPGEPLRMAGATPGPDTIAGISLRGVEQARKELVSFYKAAKASGNAEDIRAMRRIIAGFDDELETAMAVGLFKGDDGALPALKRARALFSNYQKTFRSQGPGDSVGRAMEKIVERDATGGDIANMLYGKAAIGEKGDAVKLASRLKSLFGPNSEEWSAVRQGLWLRLSSQPEGVTDFGPQALSTRISKFLSGDGADMAKVMFSPKELGEMRRFATVMKTITPPAGTVNHSNTYYALARELGIGTALGGGSFLLTDDPVLSAALVGAKIGGKLGREVYRGRAASRYFSSGAPKTGAAPIRLPGVGAGAGAAAGQMQ
jgi:spore germination cell wall hydrolase CwlJ-like protein